MYEVKQHSRGNLIERLCADLDREAVLYCQWKGHFKRLRWANGEGDIDLLVDRADGDRFASILCCLGFKQALPSAERQIPGTTHYFGFDPDVNRFIHLHVHYQILFGHHATMNYRLPIERAMLESSGPSQYFRIPAPEFELIVFVLRTVIAKPIRSILGRNRSVITGATNEELAYLRARANSSTVSNLVANVLPFVGVSFFTACMQSLLPRSSTWFRLKVRQQWRYRLRTCFRRTELSDFLWRVLCFGIERSQRYFSKKQTRTTLADGGRIIAILGGDGAGKSTAVDALYSWLSPRLRTTRIHLGKPPKSFLTATVAVARRVVSLAEKLFPRFIAHTVAQFSYYLLLLRSVCIARDRYKLYLKAQRSAMNGEVVICDRFPIPQIRSMDGPNIWRLVENREANRLTGFLLRAEASYYQHIVPPDLLILLRVDPQIAVFRKTDEDSDYVRARSMEVWGLDPSETGAHVVDAARPITDVLSDLKFLVWSEL